MNNKWEYFKCKLLCILNTVSPIQKKLQKPKQDDQFPWIDIQVIKTKRNVDRAYKKAKLADKTQDQDSASLWLQYKDKKSKLNKLNNSKMISYFQDKTMQDFKNSKKFYEFYSSTLKSKKSATDNTIHTLALDGKIETDKCIMSNHFNSFFY